MLVKVNATLITSAGMKPLEGRTAELFDKDPLSATVLAKGMVRPGGLVEFIFDVTKSSDVDSPGELHPDLFVTVRDADGSQLFQSRLIPNVRFLDNDAVTGSASTTVELVFENG